jgi:hypothetical protein
LPSTNTIPPPSTPTSHLVQVKYSVTRTVTAEAGNECCGQYHEAGFSSVREIAVVDSIKTGLEGCIYDLMNVEGGMVEQSDLDDTISFWRELRGPPYYFERNYERSEHTVQYDIKKTSGVPVYSLSSIHTIKEDIREKAKELFYDASSKNGIFHQGEDDDY